MAAALLASAIAVANPNLEILGPSGAVPPEGFVLALRRSSESGATAPLSSPELTAEGADVVPGKFEPPLRVWTVAPRPGARYVRVRAKDADLSAEAVFPLGPPAARVELSVSPAAPVKNRDSTAELSVRMLRPDGSVDAASAPPVLRANVGSVEGLDRVSPGVYRARYVLPKTHYPEVAILVALSAWPHPESIHGVFGALRIPLASAIDLPGQGERDAEMRVKIAEVTYGPVRAGADGRFKVPVVVPPGVGLGKAMAVDRVGNRRTSDIDLMLPPTNQLACVMNPTRLPADGVSKARVLCASSDPVGKVVKGAKVNLKAEHGSLGTRKLLEGGFTEWIYTAPRDLSGSPDLLRAEWTTGKAPSRSELRIALVQGPAATASLETSEKLVHYGGKLRVEVRVKDALGRPRPGSIVELQASRGATISPESASGPPSAAPSPFGAFTATVESASGVFTSRWVPPLDGPLGPAAFSALAYGPTGSEPARIIAWAERGALFAGVTDTAGLPVPRQPLNVDSGDVATGEDGTVRLGSLSDGRFEVRHARWSGLRTTIYVFDHGKLVFPNAGRPAAALVKAPIELGPPVPVNVRVNIAGRTVTYWIESADGDLLPDRPRPEVSLSAGEPGPVSEPQPGRWAFSVASGQSVTVSVTDVQTGITALAEVSP